MADREVVEITQADREAAADACEMLYSPTKITAMREGKSDYGMVLFFARHRIASTPSGYERGLEDAVSAPNPNTLLSLAERLTQSLAEYDRAADVCPFSPAHRRTPPTEKPCPKCSATRREGCPEIATAAFKFVESIRALKESAR